jgi:DNA-binding response OmpR family regulator
LLVIEDNEQLSQLLSAEFEAAGFTADLVTTAREAQALLASQQYTARVLYLVLLVG